MILPRPARLKTSGASAGKTAAAASALPSSRKSRAEKIPSAKAQQAAASGRVRKKPGAGKREAGKLRVRTMFHPSDVGMDDFFRRGAALFLRKMSNNVEQLKTKKDTALHKPCHFLRVHGD